MAGTRKATPSVTETAVLMKGARRCALCYYLEGDLREKQGQIAHLDQDPANSSEENLAWLCLLHHSQFDSKTRQHKNYTIYEVKEARDRLHAAIAAGKHHAAGERTKDQSEASKVDRGTFKEILELLPEDALYSLRHEAFSRVFQFHGERRLREFLSSTRGAAKEMIHAGLETLREALRTSITRFLDVYGVNTSFDRAPAGDDDSTFRRLCARDDDDQRIEEIRRQLCDAADAVCEAYDAFVREGRRELKV